jgi:hypothetical protein
MLKRLVGLPKTFKGDLMEIPRENTSTESSTAAHAIPPEVLVDYRFIWSGCRDFETRDLLHSKQAVALKVHLLVER